MTKKRILIVEDEPMTQMDEEQMLIDMGYDVAGFAMSGEVAVERAEELQPDLILMDIKLMGEVDGREACMRIQKSHKVPVVFVTAYGDKETSKSHDLEIPEGIGYVVKPFTEEELGGEIRRLLEQVEPG